MAGHSQFKNIMHRKGAQDKKRAKLFTRLTKEIIVAARSGQPDPQFNPALRGAIQAAKAANMPKDKIENAVKKGSGPTEGESYEEVRYEGYAPGGVAIIIDALTDNRNRTTGEVRATLSKNGGNLGESGSVSFMFDRVGMIIYPKDRAGEDEMFEVSAEAGADDCISGESHEIYCDPDKLAEVKEILTAKFSDPEEAKLSWKPQNTIEVDEDKARSILKLISVLEDNDDVQEVTANFEISEEIMNKLAE